MNNHKKNHNINVVGAQSLVLWVNMAMIGVAGITLLYYVMIANTITAKNYKIQSLRDKFEVLTEASGVLMSKKINLESPTSLLEFAKAQSLVEAKNVVYIFENRNVAQR